MRALPIIVASVLTASLFVVACNLDGDYYPYYSGVGGRGFTSSGTSGTSGTSGQVVPSGPCAEAKAGESCYDSAGSLYTSRCENKTHANLACNTYLRCVGYTWTAVSGGDDDDGIDDEPTEAADAGDGSDAGDAGKTEDAGVTLKPCATECPAAYTLTPPDATCAVPHAGTLICEYPEGTCGCAPVRPQGPDGGGVDDAGPTEYVWKCVKPESGCPRIRPRDGDDCVRPMICDYGVCTFEDGVSMNCSGARWTARKECL